MISMTNTKEHRCIKNAVANLAVGNILVDEDLIREHIDAVDGKITTEEIRNRIIKKYAR